MRNFNFNIKDFGTTFQNEFKIDILCYKLKIWHQGQQYLVQIKKINQTELI